MLKRIITVLAVLSVCIACRVGTYCPGDAVQTGVPENGNLKIESTDSPESTPESPAKSPTKAPAEINGLIELQRLDDTFVIDLKYASSDNFTGKKIYSMSKCIINKNTAYKLIKANEEFKKNGYRIKIFDAYRPYSAQQVLWDAAKDKSYVADPKKGSVHNRGAAVDITLVDKDGAELEMPSGYDDFSPKAHLDYKDCPQYEIDNRELLGRTMIKFGFKRISNEWWHFEDTDAKDYKIQDIAFESFG